MLTAIALKQCETSGLQEATLITTRDVVLICQFGAAIYITFQKLYR